MTAIELTRGIGSLLTFATTTVGLTFFNFVLRRADASLLGLSLLHRSFHYVLGPILVLANGAVLIYLIALTQIDTTPRQIAEIKEFQVWGKFGALFNPFYAGSALTGAVGYAFLIVLWWVGMHSFIYSITLNPDSPLLFAWQVVVSLIYLVLGLASMLAIQLCWSKWGFDPYRTKQLVGFVGIAIGALGLPVLLHLGAPGLLNMLRRG